MTERFELPMTKENERLMQDARNTNHNRDLVDRKNGFAAPGDTTIDLHLRTAISAISTGVNMRDWTCVAEGLAMLQDAEVRARTTPPG